MMQLEVMTIEGQEAGEFNLLVLPAAAVVTGRVFELQFSAPVCWQHFTVGVDVNAGAFGLLQQVVEIFQVVTGNQDIYPPSPSFT